MNVIYALLIEHANQDQIEEIDRTLDAPVAGQDGYDPDAERRLADSVNLMLSGGMDPDNE